MHRLGPWLLLAAAALLPPAGVRAQQPSTPPATVSLGPVDPARGAALVEVALKGLGGAAVVDAVKSLEIHGGGTRIVPGGGELAVETSTYVVAPGRYRQDSRIGGSMISTVLNPSGAFIVMGGQAMAMPAAEAAGLRGAYQRNLVTLLQGRTRKEFAPAWIGSAVIDGATTQMVNVGGTENPTTLYIDEKGGRIVRMSYGSPVAGQVKELVVTYSDYRPAGGGLVYPFASAGHLAEQPAFRSAVKRIVVNGKIDDALFAAAVPSPSTAPPPSSAAPAPAPSPGTQP